MALVLDQSAIDQSIGSFKTVANKDVLDTFTELGRILKEEEASGGNDVVSQALNACRKFQDQYNAWLESFKGFVKDAANVAEIADYLKKVDMGDVATHDTSFSNQGIDADTVRM